MGMNGMAMALWQVWDEGHRGCSRVGTTLGCTYNPYRQTSTNIQDHRYTDKQIDMHRHTDTNAETNKHTYTQTRGHTFTDKQ